MPRALAAAGTGVRRVRPPYGPPGLGRGRSEAGHARQQGERVALRSIARELAEDRVDVDGDALAVEPVREALERDVARGLVGRHARLEAIARLREQVLPVLLDPAHAALVGEPPMAGHDGVDVELQDAIAGADPVAHGAVPDDRMAPDEQDV